MLGGGSLCKLLILSAIVTGSGTGCGSSSLLRRVISFMNQQLEAVFGNKSAAQTLMFLQNYGERHVNRIALTFAFSPTAIKRQLLRFESSGLLVSRVVGKSRLFTWNPRSSTAKNLRMFLEAELEKLPKEVQQYFFRQRQLPRRSGKPNA